MMLHADWAIRRLEYGDSVAHCYKHNVCQLQSPTETEEGSVHSLGSMAEHRGGSLHWRPWLQRMWPQVQCLAPRDHHERQTKWMGRAFAN